MLDLIFVLVTVTFFLVSLGYITGCDRLKWGEMCRSTTSSAWSSPSACSRTWCSRCWNRRSS